MKTIQLTIPNMKSSHCQITVTGVAKSLGANVTEVAPSLATIQFDETISELSIKAAVEKAGYKVERISNI